MESSEGAMTEWDTSSELLVALARACKTVAGELTASLRFAQGVRLTRLVLVKQLWPGTHYESSQKYLQALLGTLSAVVCLRGQVTRSLLAAE